DGHWANADKFVPDDRSPRRGLDRIRPAPRPLGGRSFGAHSIAPKRRGGAPQSGDGGDCQGIGERGDRGDRGCPGTSSKSEGPTAGTSAVTQFNLSEWALKHRSFVMYCMLVVMIGGTMSYLRLGRNEDPVFTF